MCCLLDESRGETASSVYGGLLGAMGHRHSGFSRLELAHEALNLCRGDLVTSGVHRLRDCLDSRSARGELQQSSSAEGVSVICRQI